MDGTIRPDARAMLAYAAGQHLLAAQLGRLVAAFAYLLAVALVAGSPGELLPGGAAIAGVVVAAIVVQLSREVRQAGGTLAALGLNRHASGGGDTAAFLLLLLVALLDSALAWQALRGRVPRVAPVAALLLFAWQWWFYFYWLGASARGPLTPTPGEGAVAVEPGIGAEPGQHVFREEAEHG